MNEPEKSHPLSRFFFIAAPIVLIVWGISQAQVVLVSLLVSIFLVILAIPPLRWLEKKRVPFIAAVFLVVAGMILCLLVVGAVVGASINSFYAALPQYQVRIQEQFLVVKGFLASKSILSPEETLLKYVNPGAVMNLTVSLFSRLGAAFSNIILIVLTVIFILLEAKSFPGKLRSALGEPHQAFPRFAIFVNDMKRYMVIKTLISLATGILITVWLTILQVDFPILWGFLAFLLNYVPTIGSTLAAVPAVLLALIQFGIWRAVFAAAGCIFINSLLDYGVEKWLMGRKLGLSTLVVFLSLILWGSLLGPIGAVLCIPLTMTLKFAFEISERTRWIGVLLGPAEPDERLPTARKSGIELKIQKLFMTHQWNPKPSQGEEDARENSGL